MLSGTARRSVEGLRGVPDPELRPGALPEPWSRLDWRPLAPVRNRTKSRLFWAHDGERRVVCKDGSRLSHIRPFGLYRRHTLQREADILERLSGVAGVPGLLARWRSGLVMEFVPGRMLSSWPRGSVPAAAFDRLERLVEDIHARGVAIGDLHRRNILVADDGDVHLVDYEVAFDARSRLGRFVARRLMSLDRYACVRQRARFGLELDARRQAVLDHPPFGYEALREFKHGLRVLVGVVKHERRSPGAAAEEEDE